MNIAVQNIVAFNQDPRVRAGACQSCGKRGLCPVSGDVGGTLQPSQKIVQSGKTVYEAGDRFTGIYMVRSGFLKTYAIDADGVMQVTGFYLPGEFFGMDGLDRGRYGEHVEALDTSSVCRIPLELFDDSRHGGAMASAGMSDATMFNLLKLMSRTINRDRDMFHSLGKLNARRRFSTFLLDLSARMEASGYSGSSFTLCMSRTDIANYLCLALETVSRLFSQLQAEGLIRIERRNLQIRDAAALAEEPTGGEGMRKAG